MTRHLAVAGQIELLTLHRVLEPHHPAMSVVIPCSKRKVAGASVATRSELDESLLESDNRWDGDKRLAREIYVGRAFRRMLAAIDHFREVRQDLPLALHIASAGYGLVSADQLLVPYEATMGKGRSEWQARGQKLRMPERARELVESSPVTVFALSAAYSQAVGVPDLEPTEGFVVVIGVAEAKPSPRVTFIRAGRREARALATSEREVRAVVLSRFLDIIAARGISAVGDLSSDPLEWTG